MIGTQFICFVYVTITKGSLRTGCPQHSPNKQEGKEEAQLEELTTTKEKTTHQTTTTSNATVSMPLFSVIATLFVSVVTILAGYFVFLHN